MLLYCTEAIARALGYPARLTSEFTLPSAGEKKYEVPNHHAAEIFVNGKWLPADPNLVSETKWGYGLGYGGVRKVVLTREGEWVWGNYYPKSPAIPIVEHTWVAHASAVSSVVED